MGEDKNHCSTHDKSHCATKTESCSTPKSSGCSTTPCNWKKGLVAMLAAFVTFFVFDWVFHGIMMMPSYQATSSLWRPEADMMNYCYINLIRQAVTAGIFACLFACMCKATCGVNGGACCCPVRGAKLGGKLGLLIGITNFGAYMYLPIPLEMALAWLAGGVAQGILVGVVLTMICKCCKSKASCASPK